MHLKLNPDYARRHLFVTLTMLAMAGWFGYDGLVRYPRLEAGELYLSIEKSDPQPGFDLEAFKTQKIRAQYGFAILALGVALTVGMRLGRAARFRFEFDDEGFTVGKCRRVWADIRTVDRRRWKQKQILVVDGIVLDAWHHLGVKEFNERLDALGR